MKPLSARWPSRRELPRDGSVGHDQAGGRTGVSATLAKGSSIGAFVVEGVLGRGAMGVVYRARHHATGHEVAIKTMLLEEADDLVARERFKREAQAAQSVDHPGVVKCLGAGEQHGSLWIAFELLPGGTLA